MEQKIDGYKLENDLRNKITARMRIIQGYSYSEEAKKCAEIEIEAFYEVISMLHNKRYVLR